MTIGIVEAIQALCPGAEWNMRGDTYDGLEWLDTKQPKPTEEEVFIEIARLSDNAPLEECKAKAKGLIAASDWAVLPDVDILNRVDFENYRNELRTMIRNPIRNPVWPIEPQPVWTTT